MPCRLRTCLLAAALAGTLAGCGGGDADSDDAARSQAQQALLDKAMQAARADVALNQLPALHRCLARLQADLAPAGSTRAVDLSCAAGTYRGTSSAAQPCALTIAPLGGGRLVFTHGTEKVTIDQQITAQGPGEPALYNTTSASASPSRPGIAVFLYEAAPRARTQTLVLMAGEPSRGLAGLPEVRYIHADDQVIRQVTCRMGT